MLSLRLQSRRADNLAFGALLDRLAAPLVLLTEAGRVWRTNEAARQVLARVPGLAARTGGSICREAADRRLLLAAIGVACAPEARRLGRLCLQRPGASPLDLIITFLEGAEIAEDRFFAALVVDREGATAPASLLASTYDLTAREADLVAQILDGCGLVEAAEHLGVSHETARTHLKIVFSKLGTTRQIDLVRLVLMGAGSVRL
jgi:DNA-binding CsgD family transcriptional regulator